MEDFFFDRVAPVLLCVIALLGMAALFVALPRALYVESKCLESGYPKASIDYRMRGYCMNLQGTVTVDVQRIN